jgi:hypothetical protein
MKMNTNQMNKKMKIKFLSGLATLGLAAVLFTSCAKLPQAEIDAANAAIEQAKVSGAEIYAKDNFIALKDSMKSVMENIEFENSKFFKSFSIAITDLEGVTQFAEEVKMETITRKEELKAEIQATIAEVKSLLEINNLLILDAPKGKEGTSALVAIKGELAAIETSIQEASAMMESEDYIATLDKAKAAKEKASAINAELLEVIAKYKKNKRV